MLHLGVGQLVSASHPPNCLPGTCRVPGGSDKTQSSQLAWPGGNFCCQGYVLKMSGVHVYVLSRVAFLDKFVSM